MSKDKKEFEQAHGGEAQPIPAESVEEVKEALQAEQAAEEDKAQAEIDSLKAQLEKEKKEYLFLMAEFDNFRKRTLKEKSELVKTAAESTVKGLLPIMDDFERGIQAASQSKDVEAVKEGTELIYNKLKKYLEQAGVKEIDPTDHEFSTERHEAISAVPAPSEEQKGKILDTVQKGYTLGDKVIRHAKVVVGR